MPKTSDRIRARLKAAGVRYRANDNIAAFIEPGELDALTDEVAGQVTAVLQSLVIDTENDHNTRETGERVARMVNKSRGEMAYTLVDVDSPVDDSVIEAISAIDGVLSVRAIQEPVSR